MTDSSFNADIFATGLGYFIKDDQRHLVAAGSAACDVEKAMCAEGKAILVALARAKAEGWRNVQVLFD